ncbi:MAG TPA: DUF2165 family protein [Parvularculaceae bacterium]|nr:DUF2165 family protein [Parvularculaceae bacterium]
MVRYLKAVLILFVGLQGLFYAVQNIVNLDQARQVVTVVVTMTNHSVYPHHFGPSITAPALIWAVVWMIILGELLVGLLGLKGSYDLLAAARQSAEKFNASKSFAILSCGVSMIIWFGFFLALGGAYFEMWQTDIGVNSYRDAFMFAASAGVVMIFVNMRDD